MVDHGGGPNQPGISNAGGLVAPPFCAEYRRLFLRLTNEQHAFLSIEFGEMLRSDIVLALSFAEMHNRNLFPFGECIHCRNERLANRIHQSAGDELKAPVVPKKTGYPHFPL